MVVYGDDFTATATHEDLNWYETLLAKHYAHTIGARLGPGPKDQKEARVLNRIVRWTEDGICYAADPRQVEKVILELQLEGANSVATPGVKIPMSETESDELLPDGEATRYRAAAARAKYLSADRPDIQFTANEACRCMAKPTKNGWTALKRLARYLIGCPRLVYM